MTLEAAKKTFLTNQITVIFAALACLLPASAGAQDLEIVSTDVNGQIVNAVSTDRPFISGNGRFVVFIARNLLPSAGSTTQVYLRDLWTDELELVSVNLTGGGSPSAVGLPTHSTQRAITDDGRFVVFASGADDLVPGIDPAGRTFVFMRDRTLGTTSLISKASDGTPANASCFDFTIAPQGTSSGKAVVMFRSSATNLDSLDPTSDLDTFHHDTLLGITRVACFDLSGDTIPGGCGGQYSISDGGASIAMQSSHNNLVAGDTQFQDIFVGLPFVGDAWEIMTVDGFGDQTSGAKHSPPGLSAEGNRVVFATTASLFPVTDPPAGLTEDIFVLETVSGEIFQLTDGGPTNPLFIATPTLSSSGGWIVVETREQYDVIDTNGQLDIYALDFTGPAPANDFELISQNQGVVGINPSRNGSASATGNIVFESTSSNLSPILDLNSQDDIYVSLPEPRLPLSLAVSGWVGLWLARRRRRRLGQSMSAPPYQLAV